MMPATQIVMVYLAAAVGCFLALGFIIWWARPVNGDLSPRLTKRGMEVLVNAVASTTAIAGMGFMIGAILALLGK